MSKALSPDDRRRLCAIMERAAGTTFNGEKLAALDRAQSLLKAHELPWTELLSSVPAVAEPPPVRGWRQVVRELHRRQVNDWESGFLESILEWGALSEKQENVLRRMCVKFGVRPWEPVW
jgi:hypothetical protein